MDACSVDTDITGWILEFILRKLLEDHILDSLVQVLPFPNGNPKLSKSFLIRKLESEVSNDVVSEKILEYLERIEELYHREGDKQCLDSMKRAYCAVALDCTVRCMRNSNNDVRGGYLDAVRRIWRRVSLMEAYCSVGLLSEELLEWKEDIEAAVREDTVCMKVVESSKGIQALEAVRLYLNEEKAKQGLSFLELVADIVKAKGDDSVWGIISLGKREQSEQARGDAARDAANDCNDNRNNIDGSKRKMLGKRKHIARRFSRAVASGASRGAKIADTDESRAEPSCSKYDLLPSPEVNKVREALESSRLDLRAAVKDPLPSALRLAEALISNLDVEHKNLEPAGGTQIRVNPSEADNAGIAQSNEVEKQNRGNPSAANSAGVAQYNEIEKRTADHAEIAQSNEVEKKNIGNTSAADHAGITQFDEVNVGNGNCSDLTKAPKPNLTERNQTAQTLQRDDSFVGPPEEPPNSSRRLQLPCIRRDPVSPLKEYQPQKLVRRRRRRRWSTVEEDTLRAGVQKYGKGNWKLILSIYPDIFEERTEVDLKDKWRNMTR